MRTIYRRVWAAIVAGILLGSMLTPSVGAASTETIAGNVNKWCHLHLPPAASGFIRGEPVVVAQATLKCVGPVVTARVRVELMRKRKFWFDKLIGLSDQTRQGPGKIDVTFIRGCVKAGTNSDFYNYHLSARVYITMEGYAPYEHDYRGADMKDPVRCQAEPRK